MCLTFFTSKSRDFFITQPFGFQNYMGEALNSANTTNLKHTFCAVVLKTFLKIIRFVTNLCRENMPG